MAKSSKEKIIEDEKKILQELKNHANKNISEISKSLGFSRQKIWRIIKRLEKNRTILGYNTVVDEEKLGLETYFILIQRTVQPFDKELSEKIISREFEEQINNLDCQIVSSTYTHGDFDWILTITTDNIVKANKLCELLKNRFKKYMKEILLIRSLFNAKIQGIENPNIENLRNFI